MSSDVSEQTTTTQTMKQRNCSETQADLFSGELSFLENFEIVVDPNSHL